MPKKDKKINKKIEKEEPLTSKGVVSIDVVKEMKEAYLDYAMSVIVARALPDVRDGLKPVHRRILYSMYGMGLTSTAKFRKSAAIVGDVLGKYHPHGESSVYDAMVKMAQSFSIRYPLVRGQGNFGSIDGDSAAAMRYCVTGDTLIPTNEGIKQVADISHGGSEKINIKVLSKDRVSSIADKWFDSGKHQTLKITTGRGFFLQGSYNHPVLIWEREGLSGKPKFNWKLLGQIKEGDVAVIDRTSDKLWPKQNLSLEEFYPAVTSRKVKKKILPVEIDSNLAFILGALIAEGSISKNKIEFCNSDKEWIEEFRNKWELVFPDCRVHLFKKQPSSFGKKNYYRLEIHSRYVIGFLKSCGLLPGKSKDKIIPHVILKSPRGVASVFLKTYFEGDGSISFSSKMTELSATSKSEKLLTQIQVILLRFGIAATKRFDRHRQIHKLYLRGLKNYLLFQENIGFLSKRKKDKLRIAVNRIQKDSSQTDFVPYISDYVRNISGGSYNHRHNFDRYQKMAENYLQVLTTVRVEHQKETEEMFEEVLTNNYLFDPIEKIESTGIQRVYSLRVKSRCHSFVGNGFINHNTEAKMEKIAGEVLHDIEKETVSFVPNYDARLKEPEVLPSAVPNVLLNGTLGIAVGMATKIPPHNLREVMGALIYLIENEKATTEDLLQFVSGPDFPTGGMIFNQKDIEHAYANGRGGVLVRGEAEIVEAKSGQFQIIISSIPYQVNKADMIVKIAELVQGKKVDGIRDIRDESTEDVRIAIDLKSGAFPEKVLNTLYKHTDLETMFHFNMLALVDGVPQMLSLKDILQEFLKHRKVVVKKRAEFDLKKAEEREHILLGLKKALDNIDKIIKTIKKAKDAVTAHKDLRKQFKFSDRQATAILEMKLQKLAGLERKKLEDELKEKQRLIKELKALLASAKKILGVIKEESKEIIEKYGDDRKTKVVKRGVKSFSAEDLIPDVESVLVFTRGGYVKRTDPGEYKKQKRGGVGVIDLNTKEEDFISIFQKASTHSDLLFFTDKGKVYQLKMYDIPEGKRATKGKSIMNFLSLPSEEKVTSVLALPKTAKEQKGLGLMMLTKKGVAKKIKADSFSDVRRSGIIAIKLSAGDELLSAVFVEKGDSVILATKEGQSIRFVEEDVREMGRNAAGVRAINLKGGDEIVGVDRVAKGEKDLRFLVMSENGFGKATAVKEYKVQKRGGSGIKTARVTDKTGKVVVAKIIQEDDTEVVAISKNGQVIRVEVKEIPVSGRQTQGVRIMKLRSGDGIASLTCL